jgi:tetratricopeptide (TPR) repeat protein
VLGLGYYFVGDFPLALDAAARMQTLGEEIEELRLQNNAGYLRGWSLATRGDWQVGIDACRKALNCSPDAFETAIVRGILGNSYLEADDLAQAIPVLEQAVEEAKQYRSPQVQCWFNAYLGEAYRRGNEIDKASDFASRSLELAREADHPWGAALAQRVLGRVAPDTGDFAEAEVQLKKALQTFSTIESRFEAARTHLDLAALARARGHRDEASTHVNEARAVFSALGVPKWIERVEQFAVEYGLPLSVTPDA